MIVPQLLKLRLDQAKNAANQESTIDALSYPERMAVLGLLDACDIIITRSPSRPHITDDETLDIIESALPNCLLDTIQHLPF